MDTDAGLEVNPPLLVLGIITPLVLVIIIRLVFVIITLLVLVIVTRLLIFTMPVLVAWLVHFTCQIERKINYISV